MDRKDAQYPKKEISYYWIIFIGLVLHIFAEFAFVFAKQPILRYYNIFSMLLFVVLLIKTKKYKETTLLIGFAEVTIYCIMSTVIMGWEHGFQNWLIVVVVIALTVPFSKKKKFYFMAIFMALTYLVLYFVVKLEGNVSNLSFLDIFLILANRVGLFTVLFFSEKVLGWSNIIENFFLQSEVKKMKEIVGTDELTGLTNRHKMNIILEDMNKLIGKEGNVFYIAFADLDDFKYVNDTYGHDVGDKILILIANVLKQEFRNDDVVARWGGEEFLILLRNERDDMGQLDSSKVMSILNRVRIKIENMKMKYKEHNIGVTMTFGSVGSKNYKSVADMINDADEKMYEGKRTGKNKVVVL